MRSHLPAVTKVYFICRYAGIGAGVEWYGLWEPILQYADLKKYAAILSCAAARVWIGRR